jgi:murein DD-endopeptidase MepM/ murein hydrolase activator NlpD
LKNNAFKVDRLGPNGHFSRTVAAEDRVSLQAERYEDSAMKRAPSRGRITVLRAAITIPLLALAAVSVTGLLEYPHSDPGKTATAAIANISSVATALAPKAKAKPTAPLITDVDQVPPSIAVPSPADDADSLVELASVPDSGLEEATMRERSRRLIRVSKGDTLSTLLTNSGVTADDAVLTVAALKRVYDPRRIWPGQEIALNFDPMVDDPSGYTGLSIDRSYDRQILVTRGDDGSFVAEEIRRALTQEAVIGEGVITSSLFEAGDEAGMPPAVLVEMIRAYSYDVDFQREIREGDSFEVLYERIKDENGEVVHAGKVIYANLVLGGKAKRIFRFTPKSGFTDFFHETGQSVRRALLRTPIDGARISSRFGKRRHPILGYTKMHKGLDFAAARGTPVFAAGNGKVEKAGRNGSFGKYIRLRHNDQYKTAYAHLKSIARGIRPGARVKQGQVIGYVGTTGRSTGPHLHYEVHVKGRQVNPLSVKLPAGEKLKGKELERFRLAKQKVERTYAGLKGVTRVAQNAGR